MNKSHTPSTFVSSDHQGAVLDRTLLRWFLPFAKPYRIGIFFTFLAVLACEWIPFLFPTLLKKIIDGPIASKNPAGILPIAGTYLGLVVLHAILVFIKTYFSQKIGVSVIHLLRIHLFSHLQKQSISFFQKTPAGRLITRMTHDVDTLHYLLSEGLIDLSSSILMLFFALSVMVYTDWRLAIATFIFLPGIAIVTTIFRKKMRTNNGVLRQELAQLNSALQESLNGMPLVQLFRKQKDRFEFFKQKNDSYRQATYAQAKLNSWFFPAINTLSEFSLLACYTAGIWLIFRQEMSAGTLAAFAWLASIFNRPVRDISERITNLQNALAAAERIYSLAQTQPSLPMGKTLLNPGPLSIEFQNVSFSYRSDQPVLKNVSFSALAGSSTALVGSTGSGKSTMIHLINRFYLPTEGCLVLGGHDIQHIEESSLHGRMATVNQDVFLFAGTLRDNILLGLPYQADHFESTCEKTRVNVIAKNLPNGYDTVLREGGKGLSMGERQLVSFARALYSAPDILLLDEATASIDSSTEALIQEALAELIQGRTSIIVAHRLSTIRNADQILVVDEGKIAEQGDHQDLMRQKGLYAQFLLRSTVQ